MSAERNSLQAKEPRRGRAMLSFGRATAEEHDPACAFSDPGWLRDGFVFLGKPAAYW